MFATLDPTTRKLRLPREQEIVINDTVGFIRDLPEQLVAAFRATLQEISDSDLLLHIVDGSNPNCISQIVSVEKILSDLKLNDIARLIVVNKSDLADPREIASLQRHLKLDKQLESVSVSAVNAKSLEPLLNHVSRKLNHNGLKKVTTVSI
jgi:GTP-binding protein HflX